MLLRILRRLKDYRNRLRLPKLSYAAVMLNEPITVLEPVDKPGGLTLEELAILIGICKKFRKCRVFEFGSYRGRTTVNLAYNCADCEITTLDLPLDFTDGGEVKFSHLSRDAEAARHEERGLFFGKYEELGSRIVRLYGDSANFDFAPHYNCFDLVFVDASHRYENVLLDSENALKLLRNGSGVVLWHDYAVEQEGVVRALHEFQRKHKLQIYHIKRTKFAYYCADHSTQAPTVVKS